MDIKRMRQELEEEKKERESKIEELELGDDDE
jgi:hypothetical protein